MLIGKVPYKILSLANKINPNFTGNTSITPNSLDGWSNITLGLAYGIKQQGSLAVSASLYTDLPTARFDKNSGLRTGYDGFGIAPYLNLGCGFNSGIFTQLKTGFRVRNNNYSQQLLSEFEIGKKFIDQFYIILGHDLQLSMNNGTYNDDASELLGLYIDENEYASINLKLGYQLTDNWIIWAYAAGGYFGNGVLKAPAFAANLAYEF